MPRKTTKTTKKTVKRSTPVVAKHTEMHECQCGSACQCGCHHGKFKKFIVLLIVFLLGFALAKFVCNPMQQRRAQRRAMEMHPVFTNGCLDMASVKSPKMSEEIMKADVNADGCISVEEYKAWRKANRPNMNKDRKHNKMRAGFYGPQKKK